MRRRNKTGKGKKSGKLKGVTKRGKERGDGNRGSTERRTREKWVEHERIRRTVASPPVAHDDFKNREGEAREDEVARRQKTRKKKGIKEEEEFDFKRGIWES